jgi:hypothetical protein
MPAKKNFEAELNKVIEEQLKADPVNHLGQKWAAIDGQAGLAEYLGIDLKRLQRRINKPPYKHCAKGTGKNRLTLLRIRAPGEPEWTEEEIARRTANKHRNTMAVMYLKHTGRKPTLKHQHELWGFALTLGPLSAYFEPPEVFEFALKNWPTVAAAIKLAIMATPTGTWRYYDYPAIGPIRRFPRAVLHAYVMDRMEKGTIPKEQDADFVMLLQGTDFGPPLQEPTYSEDHIAKLIEAKAAKKAAMKANAPATAPKLGTKFFTKAEDSEAA